MGRLCLRQKIYENQWPRTGYLKSRTPGKRENYSNNWEKRQEKVKTRRTPRDAAYWANEKIIAIMEGKDKRRSKNAPDAQESAAFWFQINRTLPLAGGVFRGPGDVLGNAGFFHGRPGSVRLSFKGLGAVRRLWLM